MTIPIKYFFYYPWVEEKLNLDHFDRLRKAGGGTAPLPFIPRFDRTDFHLSLTMPNQFLLFYYSYFIFIRIGNITYNSIVFFHWIGFKGQNS
jgi:hypothetical protein